MNYNVRYFLEQCLSSLTKAIQSIEAEIWVVDNASTDDSVLYLQPRFPAVQFIVNVENVGFGKANNQALKHCKGKYVLFLNPDTLLPEDCLITCVAFIEANEQAGALGIRMIDGSGQFLPESKRSFPSPLTSFYKLMGLSSLFPASKTFSRYSLGYLNEYESHEVDVLAGAFLMAKKDLLVSLQGFDETFFMYGEDIDLSYRIQKSGYKNYYFSESTIIHFKGESARKGSLNYVKMFYEAMSIFVNKHYKGTSARFFSFFLQLAILVRAGFSVVQNFIMKAASLIKRRDHGNAKEVKVLVVATEAEYNEVLSLYKKAGLDEKLLSPLNLQKQKEGFGVPANFIATIQKTHIHQILFCEGQVGYKAIIDLVQQVRNAVSIRFHSTSTNSIVGSDSKNKSGEFIAAR